ncbi:MAG: hypothetical protein BA874_03705 [Desulfuromonadales bacterium C00003068]|jgi:DNA (cytosine-5)-methyltransferase 1|nr:MAG: hypothetical protein BA874_03705 [Desulfuromonadales bacterium C00003068]
MNELALFTGVGGGLLASNLLGINTICAVERDPFCQHILLQRQNDRLLPTFPIWDDITTFDGMVWKGSVDLVSGGFPCQAFSTAARGRNISRKDLWGEMWRVIREVKPTFVFGENVSEKAILQAEKDLKASGYSTVFTKLSAKDLGADHTRNRYWVLAYSNNNGKLLSEEYAKASELQKFCHCIWNPNPTKLGVDDGLAGRMDKFRAVGNGQVPIVAATAWLILIRDLYKTIN